MATCEVLTLKRLLEPFDFVKKLDLARPEGWCPVKHLHLQDGTCPRKTWPDMHATPALGTLENVKTYWDDKIEVLEMLQSERITRVAVPNRSEPEMVCKVGTSQLTATGVYREFQCLFTIAAAATASVGSGMAPLERVPRLLGIVCSSAHGGVIGILETMVSHRQVVNHGKPSRQNLYDIDLTTIMDAHREKWIAQIDEAVTALHRIRITWGDVKPENVLINSVTGDAWLIDFGGGCTNGWTFYDSTGTVDGDLGAVRRLVEYLRLGRQYHLAKKVQAAFRALD